MKSAKNVASYIAASPKEVRAKLIAIRKIIKGVAPKAEERLSYGMPSYHYCGHLAFFAHAKNHVGLYIPPPVIAEHKKELKGYKTAKATVQFPLDEKLPITLIKKLVKARMKKNEEMMTMGKKKMTICSRGHRFEKSSSRPTCPICWPGRYRKNNK